MHSHRVLIVCPAPLEMEYGAGQMALNLARALRDLGHQVDLWTPREGAWWSRHQRMRQELEAFLVAEERYDVIDAPAYLITSAVARNAIVVARSVQPDLQYMLVERWNDAKHVPRQLAAGLRTLARLSAYLVYDAWLTVLILQGWARASYILCLGSLEYRWMHRHMPFFRSKLHRYVNALAVDEQKRLTAVRSSRRTGSGPTKFLWIGRWSAHKGTARLLKFVEARCLEFPEDRFTIAGFGIIPENDADKLASLSAVRLVPRFPRSALTELLAVHDVGLFTSEVEGWGLVLNEMIEAGMTVCAVESGGVPDLRSYTKALTSFPPSVGARFSLAPPPSPEYYHDCSWATIAARYESAFFTPAQMKDAP